MCPINKHHALPSKINEHRNLFKTLRVRSSSSSLACGDHLSCSATYAPQLAAIPPLSQDTNNGPLRSILYCAALGSRPLLYQIFTIKRSERPCPHSRPSVTRGLHILKFGTLTILASGKLSPGLIYPGLEAPSLQPPAVDA